MVLFSPLQRLSDSPKIFCTQSLGLERGWLRLSLRGDRLCPPVMWRVEEIQRCEALTCSGAALTLESFLSAFPSCKCTWISSISYYSPVNAPPRDPTAGSCYPCDPPFWPETPSITIHLCLCCLSTYIYDLGLLLLLPTGAASHVQERHLAPQPWEQKWSKQQVCEDWWKTFWIVLCFILKENLNPRVLYWW